MKQLFTVLSVLSPMVVSSLFAVNVMASNIEKEQSRDFLPQEKTFQLPDGKKVKYLTKPKLIKRAPLEIEDVTLESDEKKQILDDQHAELKEEIQKQIKEENDKRLSDLKLEVPSIQIENIKEAEVKAEAEIEANEESEVATREIAQETQADEAQATVGDITKDLADQDKDKDNSQKIEKEDASQDIANLLFEADDLADGAINLNEKSLEAKTKERREVVRSKIDAAQEVLSEIESKLSFVKNNKKTEYKISEVKEKLGIIKEELTSAILNLAQPLVSEQVQEKEQEETEQMHADIETVKEEATSDEAQVASTKDILEAIKPKREARKTILDMNDVSCQVSEQPYERLEKSLLSFQETMLSALTENMKMMQNMMMMTMMAQQGPTIHDVLGSDPTTKLLMELKYGLGNNNQSYGLGQNHQTINVFGNYYSNPLEGYNNLGQQNALPSYTPAQFDSNSEGFNFSRPLGQMQGQFERMDAYNKVPLTKA